eukprot:scaffold230199_cov48-Prasinocladus_malaysianus.AAC.1
MDSSERISQMDSSLRTSCHLDDSHLTVVVLGASGDLAKKKTYPALFELYRAHFLPENLAVIGYARSSLSDEDLRAKIKGFLSGDEGTINQFLSMCTYVSGQYDGDLDAS